MDPINDFLKGNNLLRVAQSMKRFQESPLFDPLDPINDFLKGKPFIARSAINEEISSYNLFDPLDPINDFLSGNNLLRVAQSMKRFHLIIYWIQRIESMICLRQIRALPKANQWQRPKG